MNIALCMHVGGVSEKKRRDLRNKIIRVSSNIESKKTRRNGRLRFLWASTAVASSSVARRSASISLAWPMVGLVADPWISLSNVSWGVINSHHNNKIVMMTLRFNGCWNVEDENKHVAQTWLNMLASWKKPTGSTYGKKLPKQVDSKFKNMKHRCTSLNYLPSDIPCDHSGRQWPLLSRELPSVRPASLRIDRVAPWRNRTGTGRGFGKPCHVERSFNLPNICHTFSILGMWNDGEWWQLLGSAGFCWQVTWTSWAADNGSNSGMSLAICGIQSVKSKTNGTQCCQGPMKTHAGGYGSGQVRIGHSIALAQPQDMVKIVL